MPRKGPAQRRQIQPDPIYNDLMVQRFINRMMLDGKKSVSEHIFYGAMEAVEAKTGKPALEVFHNALRNVMPLVEVKPRRVGGATYQVPIEVRPERKTALGIRWMVGFARKRNGRTMIDKLSAEIMDAANGAGASVKKREDTHRMAEANKAFAHYRW